MWKTKYRYQVLGGDVGQRGRESLREIARSKEMTIYAGVNQQGSRAYADRDTAKFVGIEGTAILEWKKFSSVANGVQDAEKAILEGAFMGARILVGEQRKCDG